MPAFSLVDSQRMSVLITVAHIRMHYSQGIPRLGLPRPWRDVRRQSEGRVYLIKEVVELHLESGFRCIHIISRMKKSL